jgi:predicted metal-dependent hydrolase
MAVVDEGLSYKDIDYALKQSERKTTSIYIETDGTVLVMAPKSLDRADIEQILEKKRRWIYQNLAEWQDLNRTRVQRQYVNGETFLYLGRNYRLQLVDDADQDMPVILKNGYFCLQKSKVNSASAHFTNYYKAKLQRKLVERVKLYSAKMGVEIASVKVMSLKNRWGSCTAKGAVSFHWQCAMLPISVLDYIVVHELAHIQHLDHSPAFWRCVEKVLPDYDKHKTWLKFNGAGLGL